MDIATVLGAGASGGLAGTLVGLAGSIGGRIIGIFEAKQKREDRKLEMAHEEKSWAQELKLQELQSKERREETEDELKIREAALAEVDASGSWKGLELSIANQTAMGGTSYKWADAVNQIARVGFTGLLILALILAMCLTREDNPVTAAEVVEALIFTTATAITWWFGDRFSGWKKGER